MTAQRVEEAGPGPSSAPTRSGGIRGDRWKAGRGAVGEAWSTLPFDLLDRIAALSSDDPDRGTPPWLQRAAHATNRHWRRWASSTVQWLWPRRAAAADVLAAMSTRFVRTRHVKLSDCAQVDDDALGMLAGIPALLHVDLGRCRSFTGLGLSALASSPALQRLDLSHCVQTTDANLGALAACSSLRSLELRACGITDAGLALLAPLTALEYLDLSGCEGVTDAGVRTVSAMPSLHHLALGNRYVVLDCHGVRLPDVIARAQLRLSAGGRITDAGLRCQGIVAFAECGDLDRCASITDGGMRWLGGMAGLSSLSLSGCRVTEAGMAALGGTGECLTHLDVGGCNGLLDGGMRWVGRLAGLRHLHLRLCANITDGGLGHLGALSGLEHLDLRRCSKITDGGLKYLKGMTRLQDLDMAGCYNVTDEGLKCVGRLTSLRRLSLRWCRVTDGGLLCLRDIGSLRHLNVEFCQGVTAEGLRTLGSGLPSLKIVSEFSSSS